MRILPGQSMFGYSAVEIRRLMRKCNIACCSVGFVALSLQIHRHQAIQLVRALIKAGLMAQASTRVPERRWIITVEGESGNPRLYELTTNGHALRMATARKPIKRATARRLVSQFLQRVAVVNAQPDLLYWLDEVVVFGSFVTDSPTLSDVDLAVMYVPRTNDKETWDHLAAGRVATARSYGRRFPTIYHEILWPEREVDLILRNGLGTLSIHDLREEAWFIKSVPHHSIYLRA